MNIVPAAELVKTLRGFGLNLYATEEGVIKVSPRDRVTAEVRQQVQARRDDLLAVLEAERQAQALLDQRVQEMAERWSYSKDEIDEARAAARSDPAGWSTLCTADERSSRLARQAGCRYPP
jgi:hypothetical protein